MVHLLLMISIVFQLTNSQEKETFANFEDFPIVTSRLDRIKEENIDQSRWFQQVGSSKNIASIGNEFDRAANIELDQNAEQFEDTVLPKFSGDEVFNHVINTDVIANLDTEDLEKISDKYNDNENENSNNDNENNNNKNDNNENSGFRSRNNRNRLTLNTDLLQHLIELYKVKSNNALAKRGEGPQLSIVNPLDVLRQRLLLELARRRMKENQEQINANAEILKKIGKRSIPQSINHPINDLIINNNSSANNNHLTNKRYNQFLTPNRKKSLKKSRKVRRKRIEQVLQPITITNSLLQLLIMNLNYNFPHISDHFRII